MLRRTAALAVIAACVVPASADASVVGRFATEGGGFTYVADVGETNDVAVSRDGAGFVIDDPGATITPLGRECARVTANRVRCQQAFSPEFPSGLTIHLGDGNDRARVADDAQGVVGTYGLFGDQGNDELTGSASDNTLHAGPGNDTVRGGAGTYGIDLVEELSDPGAGDVILERDTATCEPQAQNPIVSRSTEADASDVVDASCGTPTTVAPDPKPDQPKGRGGKCKRSSTTGNARIVARSKHGVVFFKNRAFSPYGCLYSGGKIATLHDEGGGLDGGNGGGKPQKPVMNGRFVAYATRGSAIGDEIDRLVVWDLRNGWRRLAGGGPYISKIVVKKNGSVAWITSSDVGTQGGYEVRRISVEDEQGELLLERSTKVAPGSLKLSKDAATITWTSDGRTKRAELR